MYTMVQTSEALLCFEMDVTPRNMCLYSLKKVHENHELGAFYIGATQKYSQLFPKGIVM